MKLPSQKVFNFFNLTVALIALFIAIPGGANEWVNFFKNRADSKKTEIIIYSPSSQNVGGFNNSIIADSCWQSTLSDRADSYRCSSKDSLYDPCFVVTELESTTSNKTAYCPADIIPSSKDMGMMIDAAKIKKDTKQDTDNSFTIADVPSKLPWLIVINGKTICRLTSGAVGTAYDNQGNIYTCEGKEFVAVTGPFEQKDGKYFVKCKEAGTTAFHGCFASKIVY